MITAPLTRRSSALRWPRLDARQWTGLLLALMLAGGMALRVQGIAHPPNFTFDEEFYVLPAHNYLVGVPDLRDFHPPLGKLLMGVGLLLFDYGPVGWRFAALCFGLQSLAVGYWLGKELFGERQAGLFVAAFIAADGFFIAYSRAALTDGMLACFILWSLLAAVSARTWRGAFASAVLVGAAASIKWNGAVAALPAAAALWALGRTSRWSVLWFAAVPVVHLAVWALGLKLMGHAADPLAMWNVIAGFAKTHVNSGAWENALASQWYSWVVLYHPIVLKLSHSGGVSYYASSVPNPVLFFPVTGLMLGLPLTALVLGLRKRWRDRLRGWLDSPLAKPALLLVLGWWALLLPWSFMLGKHTFMYHYLPSYAFGLVLLAGCTAKVSRLRPRLALGFLGLAAAIAVYFAPVWGELPLSERAANRRLIFPSWRP